MSSPQLFLYDHPVSTYAQKVRMVLRFKNLPFTKETPPNLGSGEANPSFEAANPRMEVPALIDGSLSIFDSTTICHYLEEKYPSPPIFPPTPSERAEARMLADICGTHYEALNWGIGEITWFERATGDEAKRLLEAAKEQTGQFHAYLTAKLGEKHFFAGSSPGYADMSIAPLVNRSVIYGYGPTPGSPLKNWHARMSELPFVAETFAEVQEAAKMMASMGPSTWKPHGGRRREYRDHRLEWLVKNGGIEIVRKGIEDDNVRFSWPHPKKV